MSQKNKSIIFKTIGFGCIFLGIVLNRWCLTAILSPDSEIANITELLIWTMDIGLVILGLFMIVIYKKKNIYNYYLILFSIFFISPLVGELFIRTAIVMDVEKVKNPLLYADRTSGTYFKLFLKWGRKHGISEGRIAEYMTDSKLGWAPEITHENPLGLCTTASYKIQYDQKAILFYGDSFVYGETKESSKIPQQLDVLLPNVPVYNFGVEAYGVDQIYLRMKETSSKFPNSFILCGILLEDIGRCLLDFHYGAKPYFTVENNHLKLNGIPIADEPYEWLKKNPPKIRSYLIRMIINKLGFRKANTKFIEKKIEEVNRLILKATVEDAKSNKQPILFVLFYRYNQLKGQDWKEKFLKEVLSDMAVPYLDTKELFLQTSNGDYELMKEYYNNNDHPSEIGNEIISKALASYLTKDAYLLRDSFRSDILITDFH